RRGPNPPVADRPAPRSCDRPTDPLTATGGQRRVPADRHGAAPRRRGPDTADGVPPRRDAPPAALHPPLRGAGRPRSDEAPRPQRHLHLDRGLRRPGRLAALPGQRGPRRVRDPAQGRRRAVPGHPEHHRGRLVTATVRAMVMTGFGELTPRDVAYPASPPPGGAVVRVLANGGCGSDWALFSGEPQRPGGRPP